MNVENPRSLIVPGVLVVLALALSLFVFVRGPYNQHHTIAHKIAQLDQPITSPPAITASHQTQLAANRATVPQTIAGFTHTLRTLAAAHQVTLQEISVTTAAGQLNATVTGTTASLAQPIALFTALRHNTRLIHNQLTSNGPAIIVNNFAIKSATQGYTLTFSASTIAH
jgi:hypothetical protein